MGVRMKKITIEKLLIAGLALILLTGCGTTAKKDTQGLTLNEDGSIKSVIVEEFDESLYSVAELQTMMNNEISEYNQMVGAGRITAEDAVVEEGNVKVVINYSRGEDYVAFNNRRLEIINLKDALENNMLNVGFVDANKNEPFDLKSVDEPNLYTVIITDEPGMVTCPNRISYFSDGVTLESKNQVMVSEDMDGLAYIVYFSK